MAQGLCKGLSLPPPSLRPQQPACKSLREHWLPDTGWQAAKGGVLAPVPARWGGRRALLIPQEKAPWHAGKKKGAASTVPQPYSRATTYPKVFWASLLLLPSAFTVQGAWTRVPAGHTEVGKGGWVLLRLRVLCQLLSFLVPLRTR